MLIRQLLTACLAALTLAAAALAEDTLAKSWGWRGNWTGLYPDANPPTEWGRTAKGLLSEMTCQAAKPAEGAPKSGQPFKDGFIRDWLVIGPFTVSDSVKDFASEQIPGEADLQPAEGDKAGDLAWKHLDLKKKPDYDRWGTTELDALNLADALDAKGNQIGYAHTWFYSDRPGKAALVFDHFWGCKVWINGKPLYADPKQGSGLGSYVGISRQAKELAHSHSPRVEFDVLKGWNRILVKVSTFNSSGNRTMTFAPRILDADPVPYEDRNIVWAADLQTRTNAVPIVVGDRIFTPAEPDELVCLDRKTGKVLWRRFNNFYEATPEADRAANPVFKEKIAPLAEELAKTTEFEPALKLRRQMNELLVAADPKKYKLKWDGHFEAHFGIIGLTTTPVSDGKSVFVFYGNGVVAAYDFDGNRKWIRRLEAPELRYSCSPAVVGGKLICIFSGMYALDAETGAEAWKVPDATSIATLTPARIKGTDVVVTQKGQVYRVADGKLLWQNPHIIPNDTGWAPPTILGEVMYLPWFGASMLYVLDFSEVSGEEWKPKEREVHVKVDNHLPDGRWWSHWTAGSPLILDGMFYSIDQLGWFYAVDLKTGKTLYKKDVGFDELHSYVHIGVCASATLGGKNIYVIDNQGTCVVLAPGPEYKEVAVNRLETMLPRDWPIGPQEVTSNAAPVFDGDRIYLRGEKFLYCIGKP